MLLTFAKALMLGFSVAAPVGPIGVLCIRRTLSDGRTVGLACGLGAATADALYGLVAGLGLAALSSVAICGGSLLRVVGALYVAFLGVRTFLARPATREATAARTGDAWRAWASTLALTLTNPMTIASFAAMFSAIAGTPKASALYTPVLVSGVFFGSAAWWLFLSTGVSRLGARLREPHLLWVNRLAGALLLGFAGWALASARMAS